MVVTIHNNPITVWGLKNGERLNWQSESNATQQRSASVQIDVLPVCQSPCGEITRKKQNKNKLNETIITGGANYSAVPLNYKMCFYSVSELLRCTFFFYYLLRLSESVH